MWSFWQRRGGGGESADIKSSRSSNPHLTSGKKGTPKQVRIDDEAFRQSSIEAKHETWVSRLWPSVTPAGAALWGGSPPLSPRFAVSPRRHRVFWASTCVKGCKLFKTISAVLNLKLPCVFYCPFHWDDVEIKQQMAKQTTNQSRIFNKLKIICWIQGSACGLPGRVGATEAVKEAPNLDSEGMLRQEKEYC